MNSNNKLMGEVHLYCMLWLIRNICERYFQNLHAR